MRVPLVLLLLVSFVAGLELGFPDIFTGQGLFTSGLQKCIDLMGKCVPPKHTYSYWTKIEIAGCKGAKPDHALMTKTLSRPGMRYSGLTDTGYYMDIDQYYRYQDNCDMREDPACPVSFLYTAPSMQIGCHYRNGTLFETYLDEKKLNDFFNAMRIN